MKVNIGMLAKQIKMMLLLFLGIVSYSTLLAQTKADEIIGTWELEDKTSKMEIFEKDGKYFGKLLLTKLICI